MRYTELLKQADYIDSIDDFQADLSEDIADQMFAEGYKGDFDSLELNPKYNRQRYNILSGMLEGLRMDGYTGSAGDMRTGQAEKGVPVKQLYLQYLGDPENRVHSLDQWRTSVDKAIKAKQRMQLAKLVSNVTNVYAHTGNDSLRFPGGANPNAFVKKIYGNKVPPTIAARLAQWNKYNDTLRSIEAQQAALAEQRRAMGRPMKKRADYIDTLELLPFDVGGTYENDLQWETHKYNTVRDIMDRIATSPVKNKGFLRTAGPDVGKMPSGLGIETYGGERYTYPEWTAQAAKLLKKRRAKALGQMWPERYYVRTTGENLSWDPVSDSAGAIELARKLYGAKLPPGIKTQLNQDAALAKQDAKLEKQWMKLLENEPSFMKD